MFSVYVLKSLRSKKRYVGSTGKEPVARLREHNNGSNKFTRGHQPFKIIYTERFNSKIDALIRERFLKGGQGRRFLDNILHSNP